MGKKSQLSIEKRVEAVLSLLRREEPAKQIARRYGVSEQSLYRWRDEFLQGGKQNLNGKSGDQTLQKEVSRLQREVESREQVIGELTVANRIFKKVVGSVSLSAEVRTLIEAETQAEGVRVKPVLRALDVAASTYFHRAKQGERQRPGPKPKALDEARKALVMEFAERYPWWGYKRLTIVIRRAGHVIGKKFVHAVFKAENLFQKRKATSAELHQSAKLFELLPTRANALWQADVTYLHIPGYGWWYAVTVIDYYSRYLLALHLTSSYAAPEVNQAIDLARAEAERLHGPLETTPFLVTDNGSNFLAKRFRAHIKDKFQHVRTRYRTPQQLGLLERFHQTLKREEVYWQLYESPPDAREKLAQFRERYNTIRPHWALEPAEGGDVVTPHDVYVDGVTITLPRWQGWAKAARKKLDDALAEDAEKRQAA